MVGYLDLSNHSDGNNNSRLNLRKVCKLMLPSDTIEHNYFTIFLYHFNFVVFPVT